MRTNQKISGAENMSEQEIADKLEYLKKLPNELKQELEKLEGDRKRAKRGLIIPCVIFGAIIIWQFITAIACIVNHDYNAAIPNILVAIMDSIFIMYEVMLYHNRIAMIDMYTIARCMMIDWANDALRGLKHEAELTMEIAELKKGKKK